MGQQNPLCAIQQFPEKNINYSIYITYFPRRLDNECCWCKCGRTSLFHTAVLIMITSSVSQLWKCLLMPSRRQLSMKIEHFYMTKSHSSLFRRSASTRLLQSPLWPFRSGLSGSCWDSWATLRSPPHCLRIQQETERKQTQPNTNHPKLYMYTILVRAGRRSWDNRISAGCLPWSYWLEIALWERSQN